MGSSPPPEPLILVHKAAMTKTSDWVASRAFLFSWSRRLEVQDQGVSRLVL